MVSSKLIFPKGVLQEAEGIIWIDGEFQNFGRGDNPNKLEYNYIKEIEYVSGTSILIKEFDLGKNWRI